MVKQKSYSFIDAIFVVFGLARPEIETVYK